VVSRIQKEAGYSSFLLSVYLEEISELKNCQNILWSETVFVVERCIRCRKQKDRFLAPFALQSLISLTSCCCLDAVVRLLVVDMAVAIAIAVAVIISRVSYGGGRRDTAAAESCADISEGCHLLDAANPQQ